MTDDPKNPGIPLRPAQFTEKRIIAAIIDGTWPPGAHLPAERTLAETLGVTRPTVREALQRLAAEGWITICHGRPTRVNNYRDTGGISLLGTLVKYRDLIPEQLIFNLLDFRAMVLPPVARCAAENAAGRLREFLGQRHALLPEAPAFTEFDWQMQTRMARESRNPIHVMLFNDFRALFQTMGAFYFCHQRARTASMNYYEALDEALQKDGSAVERVARRAMKESVDIWGQINPPTREALHETMERLGG